MRQIAAIFRHNIGCEHSEPEASPVQATMSRLLNALKRLWRRKPEPQDPYHYSHVLAPVGRGPRGRSAAVALEEPRESKPTRAFGRWSN